MKKADLRELALKKVKIQGNIIGKFGTFEIEQTLKNETKKVLEVGYTFPIVETATVVGFEINIGDKILNGICKDKEEAEEEYELNLKKGNSSYLMEQETNNIFKIFIGKIGKNEEVKVKIKYIDKFEIVDNTINVIIPTLVTPKYNSQITPKLEYGKVEYTIDFDIDIAKTVNINNIICPSHKINIENRNVKVLNYDLSKDFKLNIEMNNEITSNAIVSKTRDGKEMVYLSFMPEIEDIYQNSRKEYIFIIDVSGSMSGKKLEETKRAVIECLKKLNNGDKFNIVPFESSFRAMKVNSIEYNEENLQNAIKYINNLEANGGTEILMPLKFSLYEKEDEKVILLFTDGQVGNEDEIIQYVKKNIRKRRIFPFGIDKNVNSAFIRKLAKVGNGKAELIMPKEKIDDKIIRTFARIQTPLLENIEINYGKNKIVEEIKEENSLFNYEYFNVFSKIEKLEDDIELKGQILEKEYSWKIKKDEISESNVDLEILFAKMKIDELEEDMPISFFRDWEKSEQYRKMIIELATQYNINSKYTSFITVYERKNKIRKAPDYQETTLSEIFENDDYEEDSYDSGDEEEGVKLYCKKTLLEMNIENKENNDKLIKAVREYYPKFKEQKEINVFTNILYELYILKYDVQEWDNDEFIEFLNKNRKEISENELYMKLIYVYYNCINSIRIVEKMEVLEFLKSIDKVYKKMALFSMGVEIELKDLSTEQINEIIEKNKIIENIDDVLWYLHKFVKPQRYSWLG